MRVACALIVVGSWVRYDGARVGGGMEGMGSVEGFKIVMLGQIVIGLAQVFVLSAPVRFSEVWFDEGSRIGATAVASLANPLGGAVSVFFTLCWLKFHMSFETRKARAIYISLGKTTNRAKWRTPNRVREAVRWTAPTPH